MKLVTVIGLSFLLAVGAEATTVTASGGTAGAQFFATSNGSSFTLLTTATSTVSAGLWNGTTFTAFAPTDATPILINNALSGRWSGGYGDNTAAADAFNGQVIWFRVTANIEGNTGVAYFSGSTVFPANGGGFNDSVNVSSVTLTQVGAGSTEFSRGYQAGDGRIIIGVVPEPSTALLGLLGIAGLIRRRR